LRLVLAILLTILPACAVTLRGAVSSNDEGATMLHLPDGATRRLILDPASAPLAALDGEGVRLEGLRGLRGVRVVDWSVPEGMRGLQTWVGVLERRDGAFRLYDRNARALYYVDDRGRPELAAAVGKTVLIEGWVEGAHAVRVAYVRVLDRSTPPR
jgi:hypothetical protein